MEWIGQLQRAVNAMEEHLLEDIRYDEIAAHIHMSGYHFHRTFSLMAGMTPAEYIRSRRLSMAAQDLQQKRLSVLDTALKYGYESPESFAKAFARFHGCTPRQAGISGTPLRMFNPLVIKVTLEGGSIMDYRIVKQEKQTFLALVRAFPNEIVNDEHDRSIPDFWNECHERQLVEPLRQLLPEGKRDLVGLCSQHSGSGGCFDYGIGVKVESGVDEAGLRTLIQRHGYRIWETEETEYAVFRCIGHSSQCIREAWQRFYREFLPQSGYAQAEQTDYEVYYEQGPEDLFCELWIPVAKAGEEAARR